MLSDLCRRVRSRKRLLLVELGLEHTRAREVLFGALLREVGTKLGVEIGWPPPAEEAPEIELFAQGYAERVTEQPTLLGWCYQVWSEEARAASTWAVSRAGEVEPGEFDPAATQLYTDEYMTEVLVERSLELLKGSNERLSVCDPACGSGHFLVQVVRSVAQRDGLGACEMLAHEGLFGADIDPFAVRLARAAVAIELARLGLGESFSSLVNALDRAIVSVPMPYGTLEAYPGDAARTNGFSLVLTNPPYVGRRKLNHDVRNFLDSKYPDAASDLCAAFIVRCIELCTPKGVVALVTSDKWLRLAGCAPLRTGGVRFEGLFNTLQLDLLVELGSRAFNSEFDLHDGLGVLLLCGKRAEPPVSSRFRYVDATLCGSREEKISYLKRELKSSDRTVSQHDLSRDGAFALLSGSAGWSRNLSKGAKEVRDIASVVVGIQTNDDRRFCRPHWLVAPEAPGWRVHHKGGGYVRWSGTNRMLLYMGAGYGAFAVSERSGKSFDAWFEQRGWTYGWFANGSIGLREKEAGWSFGRAASSGVFTEDRRLVAFLNSRVASLGVRRLGGKVQLPEGVVRALPIPDALDAIDVRLVELALRLKRLVVSCDPLDITFNPDTILSPEALLAVEALLLNVEAVLEWQSLQAAGYSDQERGELDSIMAAPVGSFPVRARAYEPLAHYLPQDLSFDLSTLDGVSRTLPTQASACLPSTGIVERLSRKTGRHPYEVVQACIEGSGEYHGEVEALHRERMQLLVVISALRACGYRWRTDTSKRNVCTGEPVSLSSIGELAEESLRVAGYNDFSEKLGTSVEAWVSTSLLRHERALFEWDGESLLTSSPGGIALRPQQRLVELA